ncbi:WD40-repeat-containing domain protein [Phyllosticta citribraziliensis]|uniref:WD40-repeat-containing domain protein n=1 Tax=Phyllosticta citribraziliensis TaxID=989973 RepID=A0ABR1M178_9PEZI
MEDRRMMDPEEQAREADEELVEAKVANEEYKMWKKNSPFLYDVLFAQALDWPALTAQWLPDKQEVPGSNLAKHRLIYGTHTSSKSQNYLHIASIEIPTLQAPDPSDYDAQKGEIGGHGAAKTPFQFTTVQRINHPSEINKARYMPQNPNLIATWCTDGRVLVFDRTKHSSEPDPSGVSKPDIELVGHEAEGFGLSWNPQEEGWLATGSEDCTVRLWNTKGDFNKNDPTIRPARTFEHHTAIVNDVQHNPINPFLLGSVSDDLTLQILDTRQETNKVALHRKDAHADAVNCLAFHPHWESIVATGSSDHTVGLWDLRFLDKKLHSLENHTQTVINVDWHPTDSAVLASASVDKRINFWDVSKIGEEQTPEEAEDGPPELLFIHGGFTNSVTDFSWNRNDPWFMLATAEDNQLQIFRPARTIVQAPQKKVTNRDISE